MFGLDIASTAIQFGSTLIDKFIPDPEQKAKAKLNMLQMQQDGEFKQLEVAMSAIVAEAKSKDKWTSRARPSFLYLMYLLIGLCVAGGIVGIWYPAQVTQAALNIKALLAAIPEALWWLFGSAYLGYTGARSFDKQQLTKLVNK